MANASGSSILDDEVLINTLDASKRKSQDINARVLEAQETTRQIDVARELVRLSLLEFAMSLMHCAQYRVVATRGSLLYFVVADLGGVDPMYQYSLAFFAQLFVRVIEKSAKSDNLETRYVP